jgi:hypothetical protein
MKYNDVARILILTTSVVMATTAISLMSQPVAAFCVGNSEDTRACVFPDKTAQTDTPGASAGSRSSSTGQPGVVSGHGDIAAVAGSVLCGGKPAVRISGNVLCAP